MVSKTGDDDVPDPGLAVCEQLGFAASRSAKDVPVLTNLTASATIGTVRRDHGLACNLRATVNAAARTAAAAATKRAAQSGATILRGTLDVHGDIFSALPHGMGSMAQMLLPLTVRIEQLEKPHQMPASAEEAAQEHSWRARCILGAKKLSRERIESTLDAIVSNGDPPFALELRTGDGQLLGVLPSCASLIRSSLDASPWVGQRPLPAGEPGGGGGGSSVLLRSARALHLIRPRRLRVALGWLRWWLLATLFMSGCWALALDPDGPLLGLTPVLPLPGAASGALSGSPAVADVLPPFPEDMVAAFRLGELHARLQALEDATAGPSGMSAGGTTAAARDRELDAVLREAARIARRSTPPPPSALSHGGGRSGGGGAAPGVSAAELHGVLPEIVRWEGRVGVVSRVLGFFTFVNTVWLMAILGIAVSIGPAIYHVLQPLHVLLRRTMRYLWEQVLLPLIRRAHSWGCIEAGSWAGCWSLLAQGVRVARASHGGATVGEMVALTGVALAAPALIYSTLLRGQRVTPQTRNHLALTWFAAVCVPLAAFFHSTLFGFLAVGAVFGALGFGVWAAPLCLCLGFEDKRSLHRVCVSSFVLVASFTLARVGGVAVDVLQPFAPAINILGTAMLDLSLLIMSSIYYEDQVLYNRAKQTGVSISPWFRYNTTMIGVLLVGMCAGHTLGMTGMANTATTFLVLYMIDKYAEFHVEMRWNGWILVLLLSLAAWRCSLFLHSHPQHVASLFQGTLGDPLRASVD